ncbi:MAG TPA: PIG-L family deacetylase [Gemmatimonadaceae bacterium]|nr:PIG-L family deacetylase [Gemmatimonadaceae bacterium]
MTRPLLAALLALSVLLPPALAQERGSAALAGLVDGLGVSARVLLVAAHPDDEDTALLAWLVHREHADAAYLSLTRGDGGQNLIGDELGEALGVIRSEELLAARRLDGATQYFTRAYDFGFSKSAEETYMHWPKDSVLRDVVTVIRAYRPHLVVAIFSGTPRDGHGHHQVSGILAREAYDAAADTVRFPRAATAGHGAWRASKLYLGAYQSRDRATVRFNVGEYDPLLGRSYYEIAMESRSQHKSQAFGRLQRRGSQPHWLMLEKTSSEPVTNGVSERSPFDGVDTTWARLRPAAARISREAAAAIDSLPAATTAARASLDFRRPTTVVPALVHVHRLLSRVRDARVSDPDVEASVRSGLSRVTRALIEATGVAVEATAERDAVAQGDTVRVDVTLHARGDVPVTVRRVRIEGPDVRPVEILGDARATVMPDSSMSWRGTVRGARLTQPWWLAYGRRGDVFDVPRTEIAQAESQRPTAAVARVALAIDGMELDAEAPVVHRRADPVRGDVQRPLAVVPPVAVTLARRVEYARANAPLERVERVELRSALTTPTDVTVSLAVPAGLATEGAKRATLAPGGTEAVEFTVRGVPRAARADLRGVVEARGERFREGYTEIEYDHITPQRMYREAALDLQGVDITLAPNVRVAYIPGAGDNVAPMLRQLGVALTVIQPAAVATTDFSSYSTVVVGTRAYESHPELIQHNARLLDYARRGGTLVVQYGQYEMTRPGMMPYPITINRPHTRVTVEGAPVTFVEPGHPTLRTPNRIGPADFEGWIQERALYMPAQFDSSYTAPLAMNDPGEPPSRGALLVAPYGRGLYVYTTMSFFRQLPAGVPGAARLFVNLLSARAAQAGQVTP